MSRVQQCKTKSEKKKKKRVGEEVRERMRECVEFTAWATFTPAATELVLHSNTHTHRYSAHSLAHTHTRARAPDDNLMTRQQHTTACHFCIHSITVLLITCKLISPCPQVTSITLTTNNLPLRLTSSPFLW